MRPFIGGSYGWHFTTVKGKKKTKVKYVPLRGFSWQMKQLTKMNSLSVTDDEPTIMYVNKNILDRY